MPEVISGDAGHRGNKRPFKVRVPKIVNSNGYIFENARGGPYKYGRPLPATIDNLRAAQAGVL